MHLNDDIVLVLAGEAGQGLRTVEFIITRILKSNGYNVFATKEYMSRIRGGCNTTTIRVSSQRVSAFVNRIDILIPLNKGTFAHIKNRLGKDTIIIGDKDNIDLDYQNFRFIDLPLLKSAEELGAKIYMNVIAAGIIGALFEVPEVVMQKFLSEHFAQKSQEIIRKNSIAAQRGYDFGKRIIEKEGVRIALKKTEGVPKEILINGTEAIALGTLAGGCNFISAYPMSPSTGVLVFLSKNAEDFGIVAKQAEDEISAINMAIGAWYAGARAMVTTSGGGFALMEEGVSLAGILETPVVIHLAQRPGPATGLPTRTEQGDLNLALYSGHGEFPRIIYAPGTLEQGFYLTQRAFNVADKYQVPVFVLTDQYFVDSYYNTPEFDISEIKIEKYFIKTDKDYKRYKLTDTGVSPRGIPGFGEGVVSVDSDEHDEEGHITENLDLRVAMVDKRMRKLELIKQDVTEPELIGSKNYKILIVAWGSTRNVIKEALEELDKQDIALLHFSQVYPLHTKTIEYLNKAQKVIAVENNATAQFAQLIKREFGFGIEHKILKYSGLPFSVEELIGEISKIF